jgi:hypothetical protein
VRPERGADKSAVPVVPNFKVSVEAQHTIPFLSSLQVRETFTFTFIKIHAVNIQVAYRQRVRGSMIQFIEQGKYLTEAEYNNEENVRFTSTAVIPYR